MFWSKRTNPPFNFKPIQHCSPAKLKLDSLTSVGIFFIAVVINLLNQKPFNQQNGFWVGHQCLRVPFYTLFIPLPIRHANTVITILGLTSTRSSGRAYTRAPIFLAMDTAYLQETDGNKLAIHSFQSRDRLEDLEGKTSIALQHKHVSSSRTYLDHLCF